jgi:hypothetical protein
MSDASHQERRTASNAKDDEPVGAVTRRKVLAGAAVATAAVTVAAVESPARAGSVDTNSREDLVLFVLLSAALTGIAESKLAPGFSLAPTPTSPPTIPSPPVDLTKSVPGSDPIDIKREYFTWANEKYPSGLENLLLLVKKNLDVPDREQAIIDAVQFEDDDKRSASDVDAKYLARSIVLMWYLGAWYEPNELRALRKDPSRVPTFIIVSPKAYTQAWALRVAQAHPMGFSDMQFGYWTREANNIKDFIGRELT